MINKIIVISVDEDLLREYSDEPEIEINEIIEKEFGWIQDSGIKLIEIKK
jgi:hypothetical protein